MKSKRGVDSVLHEAVAKLQRQYVGLSCYGESFVCTPYGVHTCTYTYSQLTDYLRKIHLMWLEEKRRDKGGTPTYDIHYYKARVKELCFRLGL